MGDFYSSDKTMFRAHPTEKVIRKRGDREVEVSRWLAFIWAVNEAAARLLDPQDIIFGEPELLPDVPCEGYLTEQYSGARVIHSPKDEGVRIVADSEEARAIFAVLLCRHEHLTLIGSDETGLKSATCDECKANMGRRIENGAYVYFPVF